MLNLNVKLFRIRKSSQYAVGDYVWVETLCYGWQLGRVEAITPSPFYGESGLTAFVCGNGWSEYLPLDGEVK